MTVNPAGSGSNYVSMVQPQPQPPAERAAEKKSRDDVAAASPPVQPTVNTSGQKVGTVINVKA